MASYIFYFTNSKPLSQSAILIKQNITNCNWSEIFEDINLNEELDILSQENDLQKMLKVLNTKLMQHCNSWTNDCSDHSLTCGSMAALNNNMLPHIFWCCWNILVQNACQSFPYNNPMVWGQENKCAKFLVHHNQSNHQGVLY